MGTQRALSSLWNRLSLTDPHHTHYFTTSLRPWLITFGQSVGKPQIPSPLWMGKLPTSYKISQPERHWRNAQGPSWRPPLGSGLQVTTQSQDTAEGQDSTEICRNHQAPVPSGLCLVTRGFIQRERAYIFVESEGPEVKQRLRMGSNKALNEDLNQVLKLETEKAAARPPVRLQ